MRAARWSALESGGIAWLGDRPASSDTGTKRYPRARESIDDDRQRRNSLAPVAAGIVKQHDVAAALLVGLIVAGRRAGQHS